LNASTFVFTRRDIEILHDLVGQEHGGFLPPFGAEQSPGAWPNTFCFVTRPVGAYPPSGQYRT
jgi:hypothetical protein